MGTHADIGRETKTGIYPRAGGRGPIPHLCPAPLTSLVACERSLYFKHVRKILNGPAHDRRRVYSAECWGPLRLSPSLSRF